MSAYTIPGQANSAGAVGEIMTSFINDAETNVNTVLELAQDGDISTGDALQLQLAISHWSLSVNMATQTTKAVHDTTASVLRNVSGA